MPTELEMALRLLLAGALGAIIGYQRERASKPAGLRTNVVISLGAALFTIASLSGFAGGDPSRIAAGIVTGIGFLGAGAILHRQGGIVVGLTTAATIWSVAAYWSGGWRRPVPDERRGHRRCSDCSPPSPSYPVRAFLFCRVSKE